MAKDLARFIVSLLLTLFIVLMMLLVSAALEMQKGFAAAYFFTGMVYATLYLYFVNTD